MSHLSVVTTSASWVVATSASVMARLLQPALQRLSDITAPAGEVVVSGLERDLARVPSLDHGWQRLCAAAWALGFTSLQLHPTVEFAEAIPVRSAAGPGPAPCRRKDGVVDSIWSFRLAVEGRHAATLIVELGPDMLDFDPGRFATVAQALVRRLVDAGKPSLAAGDPRPA